LSAFDMYVYNKIYDLKRFDDFLEVIQPFQLVKSNWNI